MKIEHLAIWVRDLESMKDFYCIYFDAQAGEKYHNPKKGFCSYFLRFPGGGPRLELMHREAVSEPSDQPAMGLAHFAVALGSERAVREKTETLRRAGLAVKGEPRWTGDGYYESLVLDPEGNFLEMTV
jgi:lactoylglutathione lyase